MATYFEKLRDPRWQKKRLEIMQRAGFACESCGDNESTLNVHHGYYERGLEPWEYKSNTLWCLCEGCHLNIQDMLRDLHYEIAHIHPDFFCEIMWTLQDIRERTESHENAFSSRATDA